MSSMTIRNIPDDVHDALRRLAAERRVPLEAMVREELAELVKRAKPRGIDFERLARRRAELGFTEPWPEWTEDLDDPALSRRVLGLEADEPEA
jgi:plasmid stability protein